MELTPEKCNEPKVGTLRTAVILIGFIWSEWQRAVSALLAIPIVRFVHVSATQKRCRSRLVRSWGQLEDFASLTVPTAKTITLERRDAWQTTSSQTAIYVLPSKTGQFRILSPICPHLGCSVRWVDVENKFICPCHSGSFTADRRAYRRTAASLNGFTRIQSGGRQC